MELQRPDPRDDPGWVRELDDIGPARGPDRTTPTTPPAGATLLAEPGLALRLVRPGGRGLRARRRTPAPSRRTPSTSPRGTSSPSRRPIRKAIPALLATAKALWNYASSCSRAGAGRPGAAARAARPRLRPAASLRPTPTVSTAGSSSASSSRPASPIDRRAGAPRYRLPFDPVFDLSTVRADLRPAARPDVAPDDFMTSAAAGAALRGPRDGRGRAAAARPPGPAPPDQSPSGRPQVGKRGRKREELRARLGPPAPGSWENLSELDRIVTALLDAGRGRSAAEFLERAYPDRAAALGGDRPPGDAPAPPGRARPRPGPLGESGHAPPPRRPRGPCRRDPPGRGALRRGPPQLPRGPDRRARPLRGPLRPGRPRTRRRPRRRGARRSPRRPSPTPPATSPAPPPGRSPRSSRPTQGSRGHEPRRTSLETGSRPGRRE